MLNDQSNKIIIPPTIYKKQNQIAVNSEETAAEETAAEETADEETAAEETAA